MNDPKLSFTLVIALTYEGNFQDPIGEGETVVK